MSAVVEQAQLVVGDARHIGDFVKRQRMTRGMSQIELAARARMGQGDISSMENGHRYVSRPTVPTLVQLAEGLATDPGEVAPLLCAMLLLSGMRPSVLESVIGFSLGAMIRDDAATLEPAMVGAGGW